LRYPHGSGVVVRFELTVAPTGFRATLTLKLREKLALFAERYKRIARIAGC
jgi:hypothetical protein